jgi:exoribonuclease R
MTYLLVTNIMMLNTEDTEDTQHIYKILVSDRNYEKWEIFDTTKFDKVDVNIQPFENKLFSNDIFKIDKQNNISIIHSSIRNVVSIPGVLILNGNKTYGRENKTNSKQGKLLYKCIPDDVRIPEFLVPYQLKNIGFSKVFQNIYVTFNFFEWSDKHPIGKLDNVIGPVDSLENFYEYQLYCKSLNSSIQKFQKDAKKSIQNKSYEEIIENIKHIYPTIQDRTDKTKWNIITIDPLNSQDFDDGFSVIDLDNERKQLSIYISNVTIWLDILNLWSSFSRRISTIYLPDKKRPMLPTILSDCLCSLQQNVKRIAFVIDIIVDNEDICEIHYNNAIINVNKNYVYEEPKLLGDKTYHHILNITQIISKNTKYKYMNNIKNSHDIVSYLMILMNYNCAKTLLKDKTGIFRTTIVNKNIVVPDNLPDDVNKFIKIWNSASGQYMNGNEIVDTRHEMLNIDAYVHITSPIRRLVDLLNMIKIQKITSIELTEKAEFFYEKWLNELDYINTTMRTIRKVQCECSLLDLCHNQPEIMDKEYQGYLFDKINRNDGLFQYIIYLPELKLTSKITLREHYEHFQMEHFKLYLFNNEDKFKKKIRLHLVSKVNNHV